MQEALSALATLTEVSNSDERNVVEHLVPDGTPAPPESEKLLPIVHTTWGFMLQGFAPTAPAASAEHAASLLAHVAELAGSFVAQRFRREALSPLLRLLSGSAGLARTQLGAEGGRRVIDEVPALGTVERRQIAVLNCLRDCCADTEARHVVQESVERIASAVLQCLAGAGSAAVAEAALRCLRTLAAVDSDTVWLLLARIVHSEDASALPQLLDDAMVESLDSIDMCCGRLGAVWHNERSAVVRQLTKLFHEVERVAVAWHGQVESRRAQEA